MLNNWEEHARGFERETTNFMDVDEDDDDEGTALVEFSSPSTPEFSPMSKWDISDFWNPNIGAGLRNMGNTCYMNSVLQCITYTAPLVEALRSCDHKIPCTIEGFCVLCALRDLVTLSLSSQGEVIEPTVLFENMGNMSSSFQKWQQEDAHDYLHSLLEDLDNCALGTGHFNPCSFFQGSSFVRKIFGGCLRSQVKCTRCFHCSNAFEPFIDLSLEIDEADSLTSALQSFTRVESIIPDSKYRCDNCHQNAPILKQFTISQPSDVLVIQLKRFTNNGFFGGFGDKVQKMVAYPQVLDMEPFFSNPQQEKGEMKYELYAVLVHAGFSLNSGHYYCFVRSGYDDWYEMDDSQVTRAAEETVMRQQAYILFYFRKGTNWFSDSLNSRVKNESNFFGSPKSVLEETNTSEESSRELSEADATDCSDGIYSNVNPEMLSNGTTMNADSRLNNSHHNSNVNVRDSPVPVSSYMSNVEPTSLEGTFETCTARTFLGKPEPSRACSEEKETNSGQNSGDTKFSCLSVDTKSTKTSDIQLTGKKRLSPATCYLNRRKNKRWMMLGKGRFCYGVASSPGRKGRAKSVSPSCKVRKSILANFKKNALEKIPFLDSDPYISERKDRSNSI